MFRSITFRESSIDEINKTQQKVTVYLFLFSRDLKLKFVICIYKMLHLPEMPSQHRVRGFATDPMAAKKCARCLDQSSPIPMKV